MGKTEVLGKTEQFMKDSGVGKRSEVGVGEGEELDLFVISITISRQDYNLKEVGQHYNLKEDRLDFYLNITRAG